MAENLAATRAFAPTTRTFVASRPFGPLASSKVIF